MADKDTLGRSGEQRAEDYLTQHGYVIVDRNWRCADGELDLIATRAGELVVVEVKTRSSTAYGHPFEAVTEVKRTRLRRLALAWSFDHPELAGPRVLRIDAIAVTGPDPTSASLEHLKDIA